PVGIARECGELGVAAEPAHEEAAVALVGAPDRRRAHAARLGLADELLERVGEAEACGGAQRTRVLLEPCPVRSRDGDVLVPGPDLRPAADDAPRAEGPAAAGEARFDAGRRRGAAVAPVPAAVAALPRVPAGSSLRFHVGGQDPL